MQVKDISAQKNKILLSNTYLSGFFHVIDEIVEKIKKDKFQNIILVVPDKFSLNAEQIFMERTGLSSVFNVWTTTLSRLVSKIVAEDDKRFKLLSKNSGTMLVSQIILKNADNLKSYKKLSNNYSLAETMYNAINLLKSSGVRPDELKDNFDSTNFGLKMQDLYLIYSQYENEMKGKIDAITRLEIFDKKVKNSEYIRESEIYFAMFDSFTNVQMQSIANLAKYAKKITVSLCANTLEANSYIYDNTVFAKLKATFDDFHVKYEIQNITQRESQRQNFLAKNLFAINQNKKFETKDIKLVECDSTGEEVRYVASKIKYMILEKGYNFDDINVAVNGIDDYMLDIKKIFAEFDLPFYIDESRTVLDHYFCNTLFRIAKFVCGEKTKINVVSIANSPIFDIEKEKRYDFENFCTKYNISGDEFYKNFEIKDELCKNANDVREKIFDDIKHFEEELNKAEGVSQLKNTLLEYLQQIKAKEMIENFANNQLDIVQKNIDLEVYEKFLKVLDDADNLTDEKMDKQFFFDMLKSGLSGANLLTTPLRCDAVFVGDASQSTYYPRKILFVLGSSQGRMPRYRDDYGTITDSEIDVFKSNKKISPTIRELNKREKFKLFCLILSATDKLEVTCSTLINGSIQHKSEFVEAIENIITESGKQIEIYKYANRELEIFDETNSQMSAYIVGTTKNAIKIAKGKKDSLRLILEKYFEEILEKESKKYLDSISRFELQNSKDILFPNSKTKVSQIERYFRCPFLEYIDYGLSPKENQKFELKSVDIGNILHRVAELFVKRYIANDNKFDDNTKKTVGLIFDEVISSKEYKNFAKNTYAIKSLKDEAMRFCEVLKHQILSSDFKPRYAEKKFENYNLSHDLKITGIVDRVDTEAQRNLVRIVDYKTGKDKFSFQDIYYGIKLQLVVYMKVVSDILSLNPVGAMYMPIKNKFGDLFDDEYSSYMLDGIMLDDDGVIKRLDKGLLTNNKSNIIHVEYKSDGSLTENSKKYILSQSEFVQLQKYAFEVIDKAVDEMLSGYIEPKPYKKGEDSPCKSCKYKALCHFELEKNGYRKVDTKTKIDFGE